MRKFVAWARSLFLLVLLLLVVAVVWEKMGFVPIITGLGLAYICRIRRNKNKSTTRRSIMEVLMDWALALIGLVLILAGAALLIYTKFLGGAIELFAFGGLLVIINIIAAREAAHQGSGCDDFY